MQFYLQPQAQFTYLGVNGGFTDSEGRRSGCSAAVSGKSAPAFGQKPVLLCVTVSIFSLSPLLMFCTGQNLSAWKWTAKNRRWQAGRRSKGGSALKPVGKAICPHASDTAKGRTATKKPHCRSNGCFDASGNVLTHRRHTGTAPRAAPQTNPNPAAPKGGAS